MSAATLVFDLFLWTSCVVLFTWIVLRPFGGRDE